MEELAKLVAQMSTKLAAVISDVDFVKQKQQALEIATKETRNEVQGIVMRVDGDVDGLLKGGGLIEDKIERLRTEMEMVRKRDAGQTQIQKELEDRVNAVERRLFQQ